MGNVKFFPAEIIRHRAENWRGLQLQTVQLISHDPYEWRFKAQCHLLVAVEQGVRYDGETFVDGLPKSTLHDYSHKLIFVPAGTDFFGWQRPRVLTRGMNIYIDPRTVPSDRDLGQPELEPRLLFDDSGLWGTILKLKRLIGSTDPADRMYAEAIGELLSHELLHLQQGTPRPGAAQPGRLAGWQQKRVVEFMGEHLADEISLYELAKLVRLSPYHFSRCFKHSFGEPPHRYWTGLRVERAKAFLANPRASVTEIAFALGYGSISAFDSAFRRITGETPTKYRRSLE